MELLHYVVCPTALPLVFVSNEEEHMFQLPLAGVAFEEDNCTVFHLLKGFLVNS